jgi:DNA-binding HxlR family transcriptional regulator
VSALTHAQKNGHERRRANGARSPIAAVEALREREDDAGLAILDDYWNAPILTEVLSGVNRFKRLSRSLRISPPTLVERLTALVDAGLLERHVWGEQDVDYQVSEGGRRLLSLWVQKMRTHDSRSSRAHRASNGNGATHCMNGGRAAPGATLELADDEGQGALALLGTRWNLQILGQIYLGRRRFNEIKRALGVTNRPLSERLKQLVDEGIVERRQYQASRYEFWPTERGRALYPVIRAAFDWASGP